jgi:hypothetical protein
MFEFTNPHVPNQTELNATGATDVIEKIPRISAP